MPKTLKDYRPRHDEDCEWHLCAVCDNGSTFSACKVAGPDHRQRLPCSCGLDALLQSSEGPQESSLRTRIIEAARKQYHDPDAHSHADQALAAASTALQIARERLAECGSLHGMQQIDQLLDELDRRN
jgi:hypothetical protein